VSQHELPKRSLPTYCVFVRQNQLLSMNTIRGGAIRSVWDGKLGQTLVERGLRCTQVRMPTLNPNPNAFIKG